MEEGLSSQVSLGKKEEELAEEEGGLDRLGQRSQRTVRLLYPYGVKKKKKKSSSRFFGTDGSPDYLIQDEGLRRVLELLSVRAFHRFIHVTVPHVTTCHTPPPGSDLYQACCYWYLC